MVLCFEMPLLLTLMLTACSKPHTPSENQETTAAIVKGRITDSGNRPIKNAKVTIEHTVWHSSYVFAMSDGQGSYQATLPAEPAGDWTAKAQLTISKYGKTYRFDLDPDNTDIFNKSTGAVRNFTWKLSGSRPGGNGYYGAHVDLYQWGTELDLSQVKIQFAPYPGESLIDGSMGTSFERQVENIAGTFMVKDIPVGKYIIQAIYQGKKLLLDNRHEEDSREESKVVVFGRYGNLGETEYNIEFYITE